MQGIGQLVAARKQRESYCGSQGVTLEDIEEIWQWNGDVQEKVETKKVANAKMVDSKDREEKWMTRETYKMERIEHSQR